MITTPLLILTLALAAPSAAPTPPDAATAIQPRDCPYCGVYGGPNQDLIYDPLLLQTDIWPEFNAASCRFEVASYSFVTLSRGACSAEVRYRATRAAAR